MKTHQTRLAYLIACFIILAVLPAPLLAQGPCMSTASSHYEHATLQAQGERMADLTCSDTCPAENQDASLAYERAVIQAQGERLLDQACAEGCGTTAASAIASFERAVIQGQGQVMVPSLQDEC